jgi:hypothetical protein
LPELWEGDVHCLGIVDQSTSFRSESSDSESHADAVVAKALKLSAMQQLIASHF